MRIKRNIDGSGYTLWLSAADTYAWAHRPGAAWPCSTLADHRLRIEVDQNGLCYLTVDGKSAGNNIDGQELDSCVAYHLPADCRRLWPTWEKVGVA